MSRRSKINLTEQEVADYLKTSRTIILVSNGAHGHPHPMPMWYALEDDTTILMTTFRKSQKISNLKRDPKVSLLVESGDAYQELKSVLLYGNAEVIDDLARTTDVLYRVSQHRGEIGDSAAGDDDAIRQGMQKSAEKRVVIRVNADKIVSWDHSKLGGTY